MHAYLPADPCALCVLLHSAGGDAEGSEYFKFEWMLDLTLDPGNTTSRNTTTIGSH